MTQTDKMLARKEGGVGYLIFNNPERHNAVSLEMWEAARAILDDFEKDNEVRVVVLTGRGQKAFVSGADISKFGDERCDPGRHRQIQCRHRSRLFRRATISRSPPSP